MYNIVVYNECDSLVYQEIVKASDENNAIKNILQEITICVGDKIFIKGVKK